MSEPKIPCSRETVNAATATTMTMTRGTHARLTRRVIALLRPGSTKPGISTDEIRLMSAVSFLPLLVACQVPADQVTLLALLTGQLTSDVTSGTCLDAHVASQTSLRARTMRASASWPPLNAV